MTTRYSVLFRTCNHTGIFPDPRPEYNSVAICRRCNRYRYIGACVKYVTVNGGYEPTVTVIYGSRMLPEPVKGSVYLQTDLLTMTDPVCSGPESNANGLDPLPG